MNDPIFNNYNKTYTTTSYVPVYQTYKSPTSFWDSYTGETNYNNYQGKFSHFAEVSQTNTFTDWNQKREDEMKYNSYLNEERRIKEEQRAAEEAKYRKFICLK